MGLQQRDDIGYTKTFKSSYQASHNVHSSLLQFTSIGYLSNWMSPTLSYVVI